MESQAESAELSIRSARWTVGRKRDAVLRLLRGGSLGGISRELEVPAHRLAQWRDPFLAAGTAGLKSHPTTPSEEALKKAQAKIGELTMKLELYDKRRTPGTCAEVQALMTVPTPNHRKDLPKEAPL